MSKSFAPRTRESQPSGADVSPLGTSSWGPWPGAVGSVMDAQMAGGGGNAFARSLLSPDVGGALASCFGPSVRGVQLAAREDRRNQDLGALASTEGRRVSLSSAVDPAGGDRLSLEILGHEMAHAIAGGGSKEHEVDQAGDPGEARADAAGAAFADYVEGGMVGPAPRLSAATGGRARVHRWEAGEHKDAVDGAVPRLEAADLTVDPDVAAVMQQKVTLGNGMELTPGQVTALMGDLYGVFDAKGNFDVDASFEQLWNADPKEMGALLALMDRESQGGEVTSAEWEAATAARKGKGQLTYLDLAKVNNNHFSAKTMEGTDNNMGTYTAFHERALAQAAKGDPAAANMARAMEACSAHYLTDRFSGGHQFEKRGLMEATDHDPTGELANIHAKWTHDQMNEQGVPVWSATGRDEDPMVSGDECPEASATWTAYGDGHWQNPQDKGDPNATNRLMTARAVYGSYQELESVLSGEATPEQVREAGYSAYGAVPQWTGQLQSGVESISRVVDLLDGGDAAIIQPYVGTGLELITDGLFRKDSPSTGGYSPPRKY